MSNDNKKMIEKQKGYLKLLIDDGYTLEQLTEVYNLGYITDEIYEYGLELYGYAKIER